MRHVKTFGLCAFWICGCMSDPRDPHTWIKKLDEIDIDILQNRDQ